MEFTGHAKSKLEIYGVPESEALNESERPIEEFYDTKEGAHIKIIQWQKIVFVLVCDESRKKIITIYRTDHKTILNRQKVKRWI